MFERRPIHRLPGCRGETIAISLDYIGCWRRLLEHLRLIPLVPYRSYQPQVVAGGVGMIAQLKKVPTAQGRLITLAQRPKAVTLMTLQPSARQALALGMANKPRRVAIVLQDRKSVV